MSQLLSTFKLGSLVLKNRVVMAPLTRNRADVNTREPTDAIKLHYEQRASAGLIISEATAVSDAGFGCYGAPALYTDSQAAKWKPIVDGVHAKGGLIFLQLWHMGRSSHPSFHPTNEVVSASDIVIGNGSTTRDSTHTSVGYEKPRALTIEEIASTVQDYKNSARLAKIAGFDGVEIHGANGYLVDQFLQSHTNIRTDAYGGSFENRYRFLKEIIEALLEVYPADRVGLRISPNGVYNDMGAVDNHEMFTYVAEEVAKFHLSYLHVMDGLGFGFHNKCKPFTLFDAKTAFPGPVMGNILYTKESAEGAIRTGAADLIAFGRPYISNPDLVERFTNNWPLAADAPFAHWYWSEDNSVRGYTDYLAYEKSQEDATA